MTSRVRFQFALAGKRADRVPFTFWRHFRRVPALGDGFIRAVVREQRKFETDLVRVLDDDHAAEIGDYLKAVATIGDTNDLVDVPTLGTVHGVWANCERLSGTVGETIELNRFAAAKIDGIFYILSLPDNDSMDLENWRADILPQEMAVLHTAAQGGTVILHFSDDALQRLWQRDDILSMLLHNISALSWADRLYGPNLRTVRERFGKTVMGGVNGAYIAGYSPETVRAEVKDAMEQTDGGLGLIVATGGVVPLETPDRNLFALGDAVKDTILH